MEKQISIIIPTYNMEAYIGKCLDSLLIPEFDQVEVLVVNDGSKDRSSEIAHSYANRYPNSIRVIDKPNGNYGSCINAALPLCTGRYVKVLDADDTFGTAAFSQFVQLLPSLNDDVLFTPFITVNEYGMNKHVRTFNNLKGINFNTSYTFKEAYDNRFIDEVEMHSITYLTNIFKRIRYHQTEGISFTDTQWASIPLSQSKSIRFLNIPPVYKYLLGREGQTMDPKCFDRQIIHYINLFNDRICHIKEFTGSAEAKNYLIKRLERNIYYIYIQAISNGSQNTTKLLADFDRQMKGDNYELYMALNNKRYHPSFGFCIIKEWRIKEYPNRIKLKPLLRIGILIMTRIFGVHAKF